MIGRLAKADLRTLVLWALLTAFAIASAGTLLLVPQQAAGPDYSCFWAGAKTALTVPNRLYDFAYVTGLQGWPLGPTSLRPYIYPPSALLAFIPFALAPYWVGYGLWVISTLALMVWAGRKASAPWWFVLFPSVAFVAYCGQVTFLIAGLGLSGLALKDRKITAGILFGIAAAIKPQLFLLLPIALAAEGRWKTIITTALTGAAVCAVSVAIWGLQPWFEWPAALARFSHVIFDTPGLLADVITPYGVLIQVGQNGAWAFLLAPLAGALVWCAFRRSQCIADRSIALFGGALLISPYAMNYEIALFAPALAIYLSDIKARFWPAYVAASLVYVLGWPIASFLAVLALPAMRLIGERIDHSATAGAVEVV